MNAEGFGYGFYGEYQFMKGGEDKKILHKSGYKTYASMRSAIKRTLRGRVVYWFYECKIDRNGYRTINRGGLR